MSDLPSGSSPVEDDTRQILAGVPFFRGLGAPALEEIAARGCPRRVGRGGHFFRQGAEAESLHVLMAGKVRLIQLSPEGHNVPLHFVQPGEPFGGGPALGHLVYPASAKAIVPSASLSWDAATIRELLDRHPGLARNMLEVVARRFAELQDRYRELATERVEHRVARALIRLSGAYGKETERGCLIELPLSRQDLAEMAGTTLSTTSRIVSRWESEGLLATGRGWILLIRPNELSARGEELPARS